MIAHGEKPTWHYILPIFGVSALWWDASLIRDLWLILGGVWIGILAAWHYGWRKVD